MTTTRDHGALDEDVLDLDATSAGFQMQNFRSRTGEWIPMEQGSGGHVWRPRATAVDAAVKCLAWTGCTGIPAMQVINLKTHEVVWRFSDRYPRAGESFPLPAPDERCAHERAWTLIARESRRADHAGKPPVQASLFGLSGGDLR